jgi:hypothetical protein
MKFNMSSKDLVGAKVKISGEVVEHLQLGSQEWVTVKLLSNQQITINTKLCDEITIGQAESKHAYKQA